jgi:hypothetical protein
LRSRCADGTFRAVTQLPFRQTVEHILELERELQTPVRRADEARLRELLAPDFVEIGASGRRWDLDSVLAMLRQETTDSEVINLTGLTARELAPGVVQVFGSPSGPGDVPAGPRSGVNAEAVGSRFSTRAPPSLTGRSPADASSGAEVESAHPLAAAEGADVRPLRIELGRPLPDMPRSAPAAARLVRREPVGALPWSVARGGCVGERCGHGSSGRWSPTLTRWHQDGAVGSGLPDGASVAWSQSSTTSPTNSGMR